MTPDVSFLGIKADNDILAKHLTSLFHQLWIIHSQSSQDHSIGSHFQQLLHRVQAPHATPYLHRDRFARGRGLFSPIEHVDPPELPDEQYPLLLTTGRVPFQFHTGTMTRRVPPLEQEAGEAWVEVHPEDARALGLRPGQTVEVSSRRGTVRARLRVTPDIRRGTVFMPFHYRESPANRLTLSAVDPVAKIPEYKACAVRLAPAT